MIKIKNKEYELKFGFKAMLEYEKVSGKSISELQAPQMNDIIDMAFAAIKNKEELSKDEFIDAIDEDMTMFSVITECINNDMGAFNALTEESKK